MEERRTEDRGSDGRVRTGQDRTVQAWRAGGEGERHGRAAKGRDSEKKESSEAREEVGRSLPPRASEGGGCRAGQAGAKEGRAAGDGSG